MADPLLFRKLMDCLQCPEGRKAWLSYKLRRGFIDLSTADFTDQSLRDYDLSGVNLSAAIFLECELAGADLADVDLSLADLRRANLRNVTLVRANLHRANLQGATLLDAQIEDACLAEARLQGANLTGADLTGADLRGADLRGASLKFARLAGALLEAANVAQADLTGAVLDPSASEQMKNYDQAILSARNYRGMGPSLARPADPVLEAADPIAPAPEGVSRVLIDGKAIGKEGINLAGMIGEVLGVDEEFSLKGLSARLPLKIPGGDRRRRSHKIPLPDERPDLNTLAGCRQALGVGEDATPIEIVKAFRRKAKTYHPDMVMHLDPEMQELASEEFQRVRQAFEMLTHHSTRPLMAIHWPEGLRRGASPYEYSIEDYLELARLNPGNTSILYNLAWRYFEDGDNDKAFDAFERVLAVDPNDEDARYNLTVVKLFIDLAIPPLLSWNRG